LRGNRFEALNREVYEWAEKAYCALKEHVLSRGGRIRTDSMEQNTIYVLVVCGDELREMRVMELCCDGEKGAVYLRVTDPKWESDGIDDCDTYSLKDDCLFVSSLVSILDVIDEY